jgi:hypothetical protein
MRKVSVSSLLSAFFYLSFLSSSGTEYFDLIIFPLFYYRALYFLKARLNVTVFNIETKHPHYTCMLRLT